MTKVIEMPKIVAEEHMVLEDGSYKISCVQNDDGSFVIIVERIVVA